MKQIFKLFIVISSLHCWIMPSKSFLKIDPIQTCVFIDPTNLINKSHFFFELLPFYIKSLKQDSISNYFLPFNDCNLLTAEKESSNFFKANINANQLNIDYEDNLFESITNFKPISSNLGLLIHVNSFFKCNYWIDIISSIEKLSNNMNLCEHIINPGKDLVSGSVQDVTQAFKQNSWNYGKINGKNSKGGLADINIKLGSSYLYQEFSLYPFLGIIIPTGNKPSAKFLFEPIVGNNKHFGIQVGSFSFLEIAAHAFAYMDINLTYLFKNKQTRMFDLIDKDWSRYMLIYQSPNDALAAFNNAGSPENGDVGSPGINYFTRQCEVSPRLQFQATGRIWFIKNIFKNEFGLSIFARNGEKIIFSKKEENAALVGTAGAGTTSNARTIDSNYLGTKTNNSEDDKINENSYASINENLINAHTASAPPGISLTFFYKLQIIYKSTKFNFATSYKFSKDPGLLNMVSIWGGITYEF